ncbi:MAG: AAA family ATPase [Gallionella sp.]|nr:AAA family ATPase [Gallionella sp.]
MKIQISNLGALKQAEFELGELTIICGANNTGKTYATYALYGFLDLWRKALPIEVAEEKIDALMSDGVVHIDLSEYVAQMTTILEQGSKVYSKRLSSVFATSPDKFAQADFCVLLEHNTDTKSQYQTQFERRLGSANNEQFLISKSEGSSDLVVSLLMDKSQVRIPRQIIAQLIEDALKDVLFANHFPTPFIASAERTGAAIFRKELNFARNRLLEEISKNGKEKDIDPFDLFFKTYDDYALPVQKNVDFTRKLESLAKKGSFLKHQHSDILIDFADIIGGEYTVIKDDELYYIPKGKRKVLLTMDESSSAVRSLLDIGFYLKHLAKKGDLLMVDEPELNLHPENQRRVARLFARLVNVGIKVFITTHSDYIVKELNTLIMLNHDKPHLKTIAKAEGYKAEELLSADKVKVYIAEEAPIRVSGNTNKTKCHTLVPATIDPEMGIEARSFDVTIGEMNRIQSAIVWGDE